jgi:hypothetical protein
MVLERKSRLVVFGALFGAAALGAFLASGGCTVLTNDGPPDDAGVFEGGEGGKPNTCETCLAQQCVGPQAACLTDPSCTGIAACDCDGSDCKQACACNAQSDAGTTPWKTYHAFTSCNDAKLSACATDCAAENRAPSTLSSCETVSDAGVDAADAGDADAAVTPSDDAGTTPGTDACNACVAQQCASKIATCGSGTDCEAFLACSSICTTSSCFDDCAGLHATGMVAAGDLATCTTTSCKNDCDL